MKQRLKKGIEPRANTEDWHGMIRIMLVRTKPQINIPELIFLGGRSLDLVTFFCSLKRCYYFHWQRSTGVSPPLDCDLHKRRKCALCLKLLISPCYKERNLINVWWINEILCTHHVKGSKKQGEHTFKSHIWYKKIKDPFFDILAAGSQPQRIQIFGILNLYFLSI